MNFQVLCAPEIESIGVYYPSSGESYEAKKDAKGNMTKSDGSKLNN